MQTQWTAEQVLALAPDAASAKNGRGLATAHKWSGLGTHQTVVWGACQGSGKNPYRTQIDLSEPAFRCSCPSRKFPCKHGLGLFLLLAEQPQGFTDQVPPDWVVEWLASRTERSQKQAEKQAEKQAQQKERAADPQAQAKRVAARQQKMNAGSQELRLWLEDQVRQGLVTLPQKFYQFWDGVAARMVDAQAPGLARRLRELAGTVNGLPDWCDGTLAGMGQLYLLLEGYERLDTLLPEVRADVRTQMGWTLPREEVLAGKVHSDLWWVVGQQTQSEERLRARRTWLYGLGSATPALLLDFAYGQQPFESTLLPGTCLAADLVFYPSAYPLRALVKTQQEAVALSKAPAGQAEIQAAIATYSQALSCCLWLEQFPLLLQAMLPLHQGGRWWLCDAQGTILPLSRQFASHHSWQLLALSGGHPLTLFGVWDGAALLPLSVWVEETFYGLAS